MAARKKKPAEEELPRGGWGVSPNKNDRGHAFKFVVFLPDGSIERGGSDTRSGAREEAEEILANARARMTVKA